MPGAANKLKVVFCSFDSPDTVAGPNSWLCRLLPQLARQGIESSVVFTVQGRAEDCPTIRELSAAGFECRTVARSPDVHHDVAAILRHVSEIAPDVFVPNCIIPAMYAGRWVREAGIPTVIVLHSDDPFYDAVIERFVAGEPAYSVSAVVCVSQYLAGACATSVKVPTRMCRIAYGVQVPDIGAVPAPAAGPFRIAYVGRFVEKQKRISDVTRALCLAAREVPGVEAVLYGDGLDRSNVEAILREDGADLPVRIGGFIPQDQVQRRLSEFQALALLSDFEGLPIAVLEAMSAGVVPICTDMRSGIGELVRDGVTGVIVKDRRADFVRAVRQLKEDQCTWEHLSRGARECIIRQYSNDACADQWAELLIKLAAEDRDRRRPIRQPEQFRLPKPHRDLRRWDPRIPSAAARIALPLRRLASRMLRFVRNPSPS